MPDAFSRDDETDDAIFYGRPRKVSHLDATALHTVEQLVKGLVTDEDPVILDLMASVDSHLPRAFKPKRMVGLGMNEEELAANPDLTEWIVQDVNQRSALPFPDETFDAVINVVSVEYLTQPQEVFNEVSRVLKPGGIFLVVFSTRWFPPKVVRVWQEAKEEERLGLVEEWFRRTGKFNETEFFISMGLPRPEEDRFFSLGVPSDPVFAVYAEREGGPDDRRPRLVYQDPASREVDWAAVKERKATVGETMECPYCEEALAKWEVPDDPCIDWPNDYLYICFNDSCPFVVRGWRHMWNQGILGVSYRYLFNPTTWGSATVPIRGLADLRPGIVEKEEAERFAGADVTDPRAFSGLPRVTEYGPDLGGDRG
jgi:SAM-dependent methyltransferase